MPLLAEGEFALVKDKLEPALSLSGQPVKRGTMAHEHIVYMMLADAAAQARDGVAAKRYASQLEALATRDNHRPYLAVAHRAWGVACRLEGLYDEAEARLTGSLELFAELGFRWQLGRTLIEMAELHLARSDQAAAREFLTQALTEFEAMNARPDVARAQAALADLG